MNEPTSDPNIFRQEAMTFSDRSSLGQVSIAQPITYKVLATLLLTITATVIAYLWVGEYSRKQTISGYLSPDTGLIGVYPDSGRALVSELYVVEGQFVTRGTPLMTLTHPNRLLAGGDAYDDVLEELYAQKRQFSEKLERYEALYKEEQKLMSARLLNSEEEIKQQKLTREFQVQQVSVASELVAALDKLRASGNVSEFRYLEAISNSLQEKTELANIDQRISQLLGSRRILDHEKSLLPSINSDRIAEVDIQVSLLNQKTIELRSTKDKLITAPIAGIVTAVQAKIGEPMKLSTSAMSIVPEGSSLVGKLLVPSSAIGFVEVGQSIQLMMDTFPHQQFGTHSAIVSSVSVAPVVASESNLLLKPSGSIFLVGAKIEKQTIFAMGSEHALQPGMLFKADIILENRTLLDWLLEPLYILRGR